KAPDFLAREQIKRSGIAGKAVPPLLARARGNNSQILVNSGSSVGRVGVPILVGHAGRQIDQACGSRDRLAPFRLEVDQKSICRHNDDWRCCLTSAWPVRNPAVARGWIRSGAGQSLDVELPNLDARIGFESNDLRLYR